MMTQLLTMTTTHQFPSLDLHVGHHVGVERVEVDADVLQLLDRVVVGRLNTANIRIMPRDINMYIFCRSHPPPIWLVYHIY